MRRDDLFADADPATRRAFLGTAARSLLGLAALPHLDLESLVRTAGAADPGSVASARHVIYLFMSGGMSHLDTLDPKPGAETQGPTESIDTVVDGIRVASTFPGLARVMDRCAVINSMFSNQGAHVQGRYFMHTGYTLRGTIRHPSLGAWLLRLQGRINETLPGHVVVGGGAGNDGPSAGFLPPEFGPLPIGDPEAGLQNSRFARGVDEATFARRLQRLSEMNESFARRFPQKPVRAYDEMYEQAVRLMKSEDLAAFDITEEPDSIRAAYGAGSFGQGCLLARRLVEHGVRFIEVVDGGWDTHNDNFDTLADKCPVIDRALTSLILDLEARGLLDETLIVLTTEFGRTPEIVEARQGRNHHPKAFSTLLAGGGVKGGVRWGRTDERGEEVVENKVTVPDLNATIAYALGLPLDLKVTSPSGRPFTVADKGRPVRELFA